MDADDQAPDAPPIEERAEELYEHAPCGYLTAREDGTIVRVNATLLRWTGYAREQLVGVRRFQDVLAPGGRIFHETHIAPLLRMQGEVREIALELTCADGRALPVLLNAVLRTPAGGGAPVMWMTVFDASDRRAYEEELRAARRRERDARERMALLVAAGRALDEASGLLDRAERLVDVLVPDLADAAHVDLTPAPGAVPEELVEAGGCRVVLPLRARGGVLGALVVDRTGSQREVGPDLPLLRELADRAALSLDNARLLEQERAVAHTLQRSLLAGTSPQDPRVSTAAVYRPAVEALEVGGDWHDAFMVDEDTVAVVVGDVVGRGLNAASAMGQLRSAVRALGGTGMGPPRVLEQLDGFVEHVEGGPMATVVYAEIALAAATLRYACAGHPPPVLVEPGAVPRLLFDGRSAPLGAYVRAFPRSEATLPLARGARLLLYTDGLVERRRQALDAGFRRLLAEVERRRTQPLPLLAEALVDAMDGDAPVDDDRCLLAVSVGPEVDLERSVAADPAQLLPLRAELAAWLGGHGVPPARRDAIVMACSEAAANAIEHGYGAGSPGTVRLHGRVAEGAVEIEVHDEGRGGSAQALGRGRGLMLMRRLVDDVRVRSGAGGTTVVLRAATREGAPR